MARDLHHVIRLQLDRTLAPEDLTVTTFEDERQTYSVTLGYGPFETWDECLVRARRILDAQMTLF